MIKKIKPVTIIVIGLSVIVIIGIFYAVQEIVVMNANDILEDYVDEIPVKKLECLGTARCFEGIVTHVIDGDTIKVDGQSIRFALTSSPEMNQEGGKETKEFIEKLCPVGSHAYVDEDDKQTQGSYGRVIGVIVCNNVNLNSALIGFEYGTISKSFCSTSEFSSEFWAKATCD